MGSALLKAWHHKQCREQVRCLPSCIPCTCTVPVDMAEPVLAQPCRRLGVCVWEWWSLEPLGVRQWLWRGFPDGLWVREAGLMG